MQLMKEGRLEVKETSFKWSTSLCDINPFIYLRKQSVSGDPAERTRDEV